MKRFITLFLSFLFLFSFSFSSFALEFRDSGISNYSTEQTWSLIANEVMTTSETTEDSTSYGNLAIPLVPSSILKHVVNNNQRVTFYMPPGNYSGTFRFRIRLNYDITSISAWNYLTGSSFTADYRFIDGNTAEFIFTSDSFGDVSTGSGWTAFVNCNSARDLDSIRVLDYSIEQLVPVEGVSSGFSYNSGVLSGEQIYQTIDVQFGDQPAGDYLINLYHWGQSYVADFFPEYNGRRLAVSDDGGVATFTVSHGGGDLSISGGVSVYRTTQGHVSGIQISGGDGSIIDGTGYINGIASRLYYSEPGSWTFNIVDVIATPLSDSSVDQFGIFGPIVGFFRDMFGSFRIFITNQFTELKDLLSSIFGVGDAESVESAKDNIEKEQNEIDEATNQFNTAAESAKSTIETEFVIDSDVTSQAGGFKDLILTIYGSLGVFAIFLWLPIFLGVVRKVLRL